MQDEVSLVSTADDNQINFKVIRTLELPPKSLSKVYLRTSSDIKVKEAILLGDNLPDFVKMDSSLVRMNGYNCETYVYNYSDKRLELLAGMHFCKGIVVTNPIIPLEEHAFFSNGHTSKLDEEVKEIDFPEHKNKLLKVLTKYREAIALEGDKLGRTDVIQHQIIMDDGAKPFYIPNYRLPISQRGVVDKLVEEMKADGVVVPSKSPYNSPLLLIPKKDGSWRLVIDYRKLNSSTVPDRMPMPVINDVLAQLGGAKVFSSLDLLSGYWQVPLDDSSKHLTAFSTHKEHLEFQVMPFGLTSAPLTFVRLMLEVLGDVENVFVYLDDVIIFSKDIESHLRTLEIVLEKLRIAGLKIKVKKCQFLRKSLEYLGHVITEEGLKMQSGKVKAIVEYPAPQNLKGLRRFLGMVGYYRPFIKGFASIAKPLTELTKKEIDFQWNEDQDRAFQELKERLMQDPILVYPDFSKEFYLACDASSTGVGAVLLQKGRTRMRAVYYASRVLNAAERNYNTTERECLAIYWALRKFRHILLGHKVNVLTDHKPICDIFKKRAFINNTKFNRWFISVLEFAPDFRYIPGKLNTIADSLSRSQEDNEKFETTNKFCFSCQVVDLDMTRVKIEQDKDENIRKIVGELLQDESSRPDFELINGILYKRSREKDECSRLYIPNTLTKHVLYITHSHKLAGHPGIKKTARIITRNYFWPHCAEEARKFVQECHQCNQHKGHGNTRAQLEHYPTELNPFQVVAMDHMGPFPKTLRDNKYILVFIDHLTRYVEIVPVRDRTAVSVAEALKSRVITRHSCPEVLLSDNAPEFVSDSLKKLCEFFDIKKCEITAYRPSANGAVERANKKIKDVLRTIVTPQSQDWDLALEDVQFTINNTVNETVGETPHYLLYGYQKRLPNTLLDDAMPMRQTYNYDDYVAWKLKKTYETVKKTRQNLKKGQLINKRYYDTDAVAPSINEGTQVYVKLHVRDGPNEKISPKFAGPFRVIELLNGNKYKLVKESNFEEKIVHWNHIKVIKTDPWSPQLLQEAKDKLPGEHHSPTTDVYHRTRTRFGARSHHGTPWQGTSPK